MHHYVTHKEMIRNNPLLAYSGMSLRPLLVYLHPHIHLTHPNQYRNRLKRFLWAIKRSAKYKTPWQFLYDASFVFLLPFSAIQFDRVFLFCTHYLALGSAKHDDNTKQ